MTIKTIRVFLADDHSLFRSGIRLLVERMVGVEIVGEASNGREIFERIGPARPDVVLMDIAMPELNGLDATTRIMRELPRVKVIILSMYATPDYIVKALQSGASGYLLKDAATDELEQAIRAVVRGETHVTSAVSKAEITDYLQRTYDRRRSDIGPSRQPKPLTLRQREILQLVAEGRTTKEIGIRLSLSENTVETHRRRLMQRLQVHDVAGLVRHAIRLGLVSFGL
jgi:DNA-binding NarL/FixJ family response regulator